MAETKFFGTGYMDVALRDMPSIIERARRDLSGVDYDTLVGTGLSGAVVVPMLADALGKHFVIVRKEDDGSHHGGLMIGTFGERWLFVDDLISSGRTLQRVRDAIRKATERQYNALEHPTLFVGAFLYGQVGGPWDHGKTLYRKRGEV